MFEVGDRVKIKPDAWERYVKVEKPWTKHNPSPQTITVICGHNLLATGITTGSIRLGFQSDDISRLDFFFDEKDLEPYKETYAEYIASELKQLGLTKAVCPHCGNDDQDLMAENSYFTHEHHNGLNYQCHNRPSCGKYFQVGPLSRCPCGWNSIEAKKQKQLGYEWCWCWDELSYAYRNPKTIRDYREWAKTKSPEQLKAHDDAQKRKDKEAGDVIKAKLNQQPYNSNGFREDIIAMEDRLFNEVINADHPFTVSNIQVEDGTMSVDIAIQPINWTDIITRFYSQSEAPTFPVDEHGYEVVKQLLIKDQLIQVGSQLRCSCQYEVQKLYPRWDIETKRVLDKGSNFSYLVKCDEKCLLHGKRE